MDTVKDWFIAFVARDDNPLGLLVLGGASLIEYVFPPFPGDTITLFGAVLITAYGWSLLGVFGAVMAGSVAGSMLVYGLGLAIERRRERHPERSGPRKARIDTLIERFRRHGAVYLVLNRFLPGFRAVFFLAAGMARLRPLAVLAYGAASAALWNLAVIGLGSAVGASFESLQAGFEVYLGLVWVGLGTLALVTLLRHLWQRRRARRAAPPDGGP